MAARPTSSLPSQPHALPDFLQKNTIRYALQPAAVLPPRPRQSEIIEDGELYLHHAQSPRGPGIDRSFTSSTLESKYEKDVRSLTSQEALLGHCPDEASVPTYIDEKRLSQRTTYISIQEPESSSGTPPLPRAWVLEILSCVLVVFSFIALIATLYYYQGKPPPQWPLGLSINTLVSVYGVVFQVPMLLLTAEGLGQLKWHWFMAPNSLHYLEVYDEASRGPWGSLKLLWKVRGR